MKHLITILFLCLVAMPLMAQSVEISGGTSNIPYPFYSGYGYNYAAALYLGSEISMTGGITSIAFYHNGGMSLKAVPCEILLKLTDNATLPTTDWAALRSGATSVYSGSFYYGSTTPGWTVCSFSSPFTFPSGKNLLVLTTATPATGGDPWGSGGGETHWGHFAANMVAVMMQDMDPPAILDPITDRPNITIGFTPLPVQLAGFTASRISDALVLNWKTISEVNNYGFSVQSRTTANPVFTDIPGAFVGGHGTTTEQHTYSWSIIAPDPTVIAYRLKQVDLDGTTYYSDPVSIGLTNVRESAPTVFALHQNYPNPFNPSTTVRFGMRQAGHVAITVYSALGQEVIRLADAEFDAGYHLVTLNGASLPSGVYYYRMQTNGFAETKTLLLMK
jgi:hypothetical protein